MTGAVRGFWRGTGTGCGVMAICGVSLVTPTRSRPGMASGFGRKVVATASTMAAATGSRHPQTRAAWRGCRSHRSRCQHARFEMRRVLVLLRVFARQIAKQTAQQLFFVSISHLLPTSVARHGALSSALSVFHQQPAPLDQHLSRAAQARANRADGTADDSLAASSYESPFNSHSTTTSR